MCAWRTDITDGGSVRALADAVREAAGGRVELVANVAGVCLTAPFAETTDDDWEYVMESNFMGHVRVTRALLPLVTESAKGGGRAPLPRTILFVNSFGAILPLKGMSAYTASKFALRGLAESLRPELAPLGVQVSAVHPGVIASDFLERAVYKSSAVTKESMAELLSSGTPFIQTPEEVARACMDAVRARRDESLVGAPFQAAAAAYRLTGANPFALAGPDTARLP